MTAGFLNCFEEQNGKIEGEISPASNVKSQKKSRAAGEK